MTSFSFFILLFQSQVIPDRGDHGSITYFVLQRIIKGQEDLKSKQVCATAFLSIEDKVVMCLLLDYIFSPRKNVIKNKL